MKWKTAITTIQEEKEYIHGEALENLVQKYSFAEGIFFLLRGKFPNEKETKVWNALLVAAIDHGAGTSSSIAARTVASAGNSLNSAVGAGILALGDLHGGAIESAAQFFTQHQEEDVALLAENMRSKKIRVAGYGHRVFKNVDPRTKQLFDMARTNQVAGKFCDFAENFEKALAKASGKNIPLNIDGAMAAIALDMGFDVSVMKGIFIIARTPGLVAQAHEELIQKNGPFRFSEEEIEYIKK